jgi:hypothetical protein
MRFTRNLIVLAAAAAVYLALPAQANANSLTLNAVLVNHAYQQTVNRPCVIGEESCTYVTATTGDEAVFPTGPDGHNVDITSEPFLVSTIRALFGGTGDNFVVGFDVNQSNDVQTFNYFAMYINGVLVDQWLGGPVGVPPTVGGGNGNGYADYLLTGFTSLAGYAANDIVTFRAILSGLNDGREQFFLIETQGPNPCTGELCNPVVPEPGTLLMFGTGLALLAARLRRRKA